MHAAPTWTFSNSEALRVCRDIAWSELSANAGMRARLQAAKLQRLDSLLDWSEQSLAADSLTRTSLATAVATWCDAFDSGYSDLFLARKNTQEWAHAMLRARAASHAVAQAQSGHARAAITFSTSGSMGQPKHIRHREATLWQETQGWAQQLVGRKRVVVCCPVHHIYGFIWGVMLPQALGVPVIELAWDSPDLATQLESGDLLVAVPTQWQWWTQAQQIQRWPADVIGVSSTAALPAAAAQAAHAQGLKHLLAIYGSTETAGLGWRDEVAAVTDPQAALYRLGPARRRVPEGEGIAVCLPDGMIAPLVLQDIIEWHSDTQFAVLRRQDDVVQVGGHNVSPLAIAQTLQTHPDVQAAAVRLNTSLSVPRLKAFVVLREHCTAQAFEQWLSTLAPHTQPTSIRYGDALPSNSLGKASDWD
jgi:long-chain acyl-CoA synthetase